MFILSSYAQHITDFFWQSKLFRDYKCNFSLAPCRIYAAVHTISFFFFFSLILSPFHNTMTAHSILLLITIWTVCNWECKLKRTLSDLKGFCLIVDKVCSSAGVSVTRSPNAHRFGSTCACFVSSPSSPLLFPLLFVSCDSPFHMFCTYVIEWRSTSVQMLGPWR